MVNGTFGSYGSFDDRDDARLHVKQWLRSHGPSDYTQQNMRRLVRDMMASDTEPVDHVHVAWRERGYGIVKGLVEFAGEELLQSLPPTQSMPSMPSQGSGSAGLHRAHEELAKAAALLPNRAAAAMRHLREALDVLSEQGMAASRSVERASLAATLALSMIGGKAEVPAAA